MKALRLNDADELETFEAPPAQLEQDEEVLIRVEAAGLNRADFRRRLGPRQAASPVSEIAGVEIAGEVVTVGPRATNVAVGDRVMAMVTGAFAETAVADHRVVIPIPGALPFTTAAAVPVAYMTAHNAVVTAGGLVRGETVLVTAGSSTVGLAACELSLALGAERVLATVRSQRSLERIQALYPSLTALLGGDGREVFDDLRDLLGDDAIHLIIDHVGGPALRDNLRILSVGGRLISVGRLAGMRGELDMDLLSFKQARLEGVTFRTRSTSERGQVAMRMMEDLRDPLSNGTLSPPIDSVFPMGRADEARTRMMTDQHFGKIVLESTW